MKKIKVNEERLRRLAERLVSDECKSVFYMFGPCSEDCKEVIIRMDAIPSLDAAISEAYIVFPEEWGWDQEEEIAYLLTDGTKDPRTSAKMFFGLDDAMFRHLFVPFSQHPLIYGGTRLEALITPTMVGRNIFEFLDRYKMSLN